MRVVSAARTDVINGFFLGNLGQQLRQDGGVADGVVGDFNAALYRAQFVVRYFVRIFFSSVIRSAHQISGWHLCSKAEIYRKEVALS